MTDKQTVFQTDMWQVSQMQLVVNVVKLSWTWHCISGGCQFVYKAGLTSLSLVQCFVVFYGKVKAKQIVCMSVQPWMVDNNLGYVKPLSHTT